MEARMKLNEQITVGGQPTEEQLAELKQAGFKTVINLRTEGEENQPLSPEAEAGKVQAQGMEYRHLPVSPQAMGPELVDRFRHELEQLPAPVFVHCASGMRAGAFSMMHLATQAGWSGDDTLRKAEQMGFECKQPELKEFVKGYIDSHQG